MPRLRGAFPSPRHRLAAATPHVPIGDTPSQFFWKPVQLSMWGNDVNGDCVTAEEAAAKACVPGIFLPDDVVIGWAKANGFLNGADLITVLDLMETKGFEQDGKTYDDGSPVSVDWTDAAVLKNAIAQGPVKIGVAADQLQNVVPDPPVSGWFATGFTPDSNEDHCVGLRGYGSISWLAEQIAEAFGVTVTVPDGVNGDGPGYAMFTWDSYGIIDEPSMLAITGEAWLRNPTSVS